MARTFQRKQHLSAMSEINVTPLIDLAFALLIIFMITAPLLEQSIDINLPKESPRSQRSEPEPMQEIAIDRDGRLYWGTEAVSSTRLEELIELLSIEPEPPVISIRADSQLPYQRVIDLIDMIKRYKLSRISLETTSK